jgi:hypothetical protein
MGGLRPYIRWARKLYLIKAKVTKLSVFKLYRDLPALVFYQLEKHIKRIGIAIARSLDEVLSVNYCW